MGCIQKKYKYHIIHDRSYAPRQSINHHIDIDEYWMNSVRMSYLPNVPWICIQTYSSALRILGTAWIYIEGVQPYHKFISVTLFLWYCITVWSKIQSWALQWLCLSLKLYHAIQWCNMGWPLSWWFYYGRSYRVHSLSTQSSDHTNNLWRTWIVLPTTSHEFLGIVLDTEMMEMRKAKQHWQEILVELVHCYQSTTGQDKVLSDKCWIRPGQ